MFSSSHFPQSLGLQPSTKSFNLGWLIFSLGQQLVNFNLDWLLALGIHILHHYAYIVMFIISLEHTSFHTY